MSQQYSQHQSDAVEQTPGTMDQVKSLHGWSILVGAGIGIIIGLILGWVVWPVQWTDAWPSDLNQEAKSQYLASVAQVYTYYPEDRAAEAARMKLYNLNENLDEEIAAAQAYFDDNPQRDSRVYISALAQMAEGLGISSDDIIIPSGAAEETAAGDEAAAASSGGSSWARWLFSLLFVVVLIGGGIYIISRLAQRRQDLSDEQGNGDSLPPQSTYAGAQPAATGTTDPDSSATRSASSGFDIPAADDYQFDQEPEDAILYTAGAAVVADEAFVDDAYFDETSAASPADSEEPGQLTPEEAPAAEPVVPPVAATSEPISTAPVGSDRADAGKVLSTYLVHYQAGIVDFEQSHNIIEPSTSRYIGECGMGVNVKNGILQDVPENVIALDVWLFDQKRDRSLGNQTRVLLSEYAIDHDLEQAFIREQPDGPTPIVAQPGVSFQLKGQNLVLDCEVLEADYTSSGEDSGIFQSVKVELTVRLRD